MIRKNQVPFVIRYTHLSKGTNYLKQKCTQLMTPLWDKVFHALSHSVTHFVSWVLLAPETSFSSKYQSETSISKFLEPTLKTKYIKPCKKAGKTVRGDGVRNCVHYCLRPLVPFKICETQEYVSSLHLFVYQKKVASWDHFPPLHDWFLLPGSLSCYFLSSVQRAQLLL